MHIQYIELSDIGSDLGTQCLGSLVKGSVWTAPICKQTLIITSFTSTKKQAFYAQGQLLLYNSHCCNLSQYTSLLSSFPMTRRIINKGHGLTTKGGTLSAAIWTFSSWYCVLETRVTCRGIWQKVVFFSQDTFSLCYKSIICCGISHRKQALHVRAYILWHTGTVLYMYPCRTPL